MQLSNLKLIDENYFAAEIVLPDAADVLRVEGEILWPWIQFDHAAWQNGGEGGFDALIKNYEGIKLELRKAFEAISAREDWFDFPPLNARAREMMQHA